MIQIHSRPGLVQIPSVKAVYRFPIISIINSNSQPRPSQVPFLTKRGEVTPEKQPNPEGRTTGYETMSLLVSQILRWILFPHC